MSKPPTSIRVRFSLTNVLIRAVYNSFPRKALTGIRCLLTSTALLSVWFAPAFSLAQTDFVTRIQPGEDITADFIDLLFNVDVQAIEPKVDQSIHVNLSKPVEQIAPAARVAKNALNKKIENSKPKPTLSIHQLHRQARISRCLAMYYRMPVDAQQWRPWTIMHGLLPYGQNSHVKSNGQTIRAVDYLCQNHIGNDTRMLHLSGNSLGVSVGPGVQGHEGQFLAMLAQADAPVSQQIQIQNRLFSIKDLIEYEKQGCRQQSELTFKLIGLSHYISADEVWRSNSGQSWNLERLIHEEIKQPINGAACGGTHRLMGLSYAIKKRAESGKGIDGEWARAKHYINQYQDYAMQFQNPDGSFSTNWFVTQEADVDLKKRLYTTGHVVEWLAFSLSDERINDPRLARAIDYLVNLMLTAPSLDLEIGPRGHAIHALRLYEQRIFGVNSDIQAISPADLAIVERALIQQQNMKPEFVDSTFGNVGQPVSYPGQGIPFKRRPFRRR